MPSLYDFGAGVPDLIRGINTYNDTESLINQRRIASQKTQFELDQLKKQEELLNKDILFGGFLEAKGVNPAVKERTLKYGQGLGYIDPAGRVKMRDIPYLLKALSEDKEYQLGVMEDNYNFAQSKSIQARQALEKFDQDNPFYETDQKLMQERSKLASIVSYYNTKEYNLKNAMDKLTGAHGDIKVGGNPKNGIYTYDDRGNVNVIREPQAEQPKAPTVHTFTEGNRIIEKQWNPSTQSWDVISTAPRYKPPTDDISRYQEIKTATELRKEFNNRPEVKEYNQMMPKIASIDKALIEAQTSGNKVAADQALITLFNKLTDPNSVVRESEYARTPENLSFINKMRGKIAKMATGGAGLTNSDRQAIVNMAKQMQAAYQEIFNDVANEYTDYATGYKLDPTLVIGERRKTTQSPPKRLPNETPEQYISRVGLK